MTTNKTLFWVDITLFVVLIATLISVSADIFTHSNIHVFLGLSLCVFAILHLSLHWNWIKNILHRYDSLPKPARSNVWFSIGLFCGYILSGSIGLLARVLPFSLHQHVFLGYIHACISALVLFLQVVHIIRHWKWITTIARKISKLSDKIIEIQ